MVQQKVIPKTSLIKVKSQKFWQCYFISTEEAQPGHHHELLDEELRVENGDVGGASDQGVGRGLEGVVDVVSDDGHGRVSDQWLEDVMQHLGVDGTWCKEGEDKCVYSYCSGTWETINSHS